MGIIEENRAYSQERLKKLEDSLNSEFDNAPIEFEDLSIYLSGSYGRLEANRNSDLDPFFVWLPKEAGLEFGRLCEIRLFYRFVEVIGRLSFAPLTDDGRYLEIHSLGTMREKLGGAHDDYLNLFTARMLLLLESQPIWNRMAYNRLMRRVVDFYFEDYHDHEKAFRPLFLVNDIIKYWKTLCLNYEHKRHMRVDEKLPPEERDAKKSKAHLQNLKLKFSRLLTCFSMVVPLMSESTSDPDSVVKLVQMTPLERLQSAAGVHGREYEVVRSLYEGFLQEVRNPEVQTKMIEEAYRNEQFAKAREFHKSLYDFFDVTVSSDLKQYAFM